jgi:ribosomal protein S27E
MCGQKLPANINFCPYCGNRLAAVYSSNLNFVKPVECIHEFKHFICTKCGAKAPKPSLTALGKKMYNQYTYEYYRASGPEEARYFLEQTEVTLPLYYIMVETPAGKWGRDKDGMFLERLCDFQRNLSLAQCQAQTSLFPNRWEDLQLAANKVTDNFLLSVACGSCGYEWTDGVAYRSKTIVRCPECGKYNLADTQNIRVNNL